MTRYWKAIVGFISPGAVLIGAAVTDGSQGGSHITTAEWITALVACVVTSGAVYAAPKNAEPGEGGNIDLVTIVYVLAGVFFVVATLNLLGVGTRGLF